MAASLLETRGLSARGNLHLTSDTVTGRVWCSFAFCYDPDQRLYENFEALGREFVSALSEEKLIEMLTEIQSDIRQIKFDLQLLLKWQSKP
jgi:hypothetical protein